MTDALTIGGTTVPRGSDVAIELPLANLYTHTPLTMPVRVIAGRKPGPVMFVSAGVHGDELNGVEIIRRLLRLPALKRLRGTLVAVPVVNVPAFINRSRYLPDGRDLNRSFPGRDTGSLAARIAYGFINEIVSQCDYGIDLHTGARHRANLPQVRASLSNPVTHELAMAFGAPLLLDSRPASGTLREYTTANQIPVLLYESGEALRFDETCIRVGVHGIVNVMRALKMLPPSRRRHPPPQPAVAASSHWVRAPQSGVLRSFVALGEWVQAGQTLAVVADTMGGSEQPVEASDAGVVIGRVNLPLAFEGEALFHIAQTGDAQAAADRWDKLQGDEAPTPMSDEPAIA